MTRRHDCIIVGGGVIGLSIARSLAAEGLAVLIVERGRCGGESSWAGAGVLAPCNPHRDDAAASLRRASLAMYPAFCEELLAETGVDSEYEPCGELEIALNEDALRSLLADEQAGKKRRLPDGREAYRFLDPNETAKLEPAVSGPILGALECRETAQVRNPRLLRALRTSCERRGVDIREGMPVRDLTVEGSRVVGVRTDGDRFMSGAVILSAGAWSSSIDDRIQRVMPVVPVRGQMVLLRFERRPFTRVISRGKTYLVPRRDGHVLLGATEEHDAEFVKRNTPAGIARLYETGVRLAPAIADAPVVTQWAGLRPGTPDDNPYLGPVPGYEGLLAATGHFRAGLILAPITARITTGIVVGRSADPELDLAPFRVGRIFAR